LLLLAVDFNQEAKAARLGYGARPEQAPWAKDDSNAMWTGQSMATAQ